MNGKEILDEQEAKEQAIDIPEWGGMFLVRELSGEAREQFEEASRGEGNYKNQARAVIVAFSLYHVDGTPVWKDPRTAVHALSRKPFRILSKISDIAVTLSLTTLEDLEEEERK